MVQHTEHTEGAEQDMVQHTEHTEGAEDSALIVKNLDTVSELVLLFSYD